MVGIRIGIRRVVVRQIRLWWWWWTTWVCVRSQCRGRGRSRGHIRGRRDSKWRLFIPNETSFSWSRRSSKSTTLTLAHTLPGSTETYQLCSRPTIFTGRSLREGNLGFCTCLKGRWYHPWRICICQPRRSVVRGRVEGIIQHRLMAVIWVGDHRRLDCTLAEFVTPLSTPISFDWCCSNLAFRIKVVILLAHWCSQLTP